MLVKLIGTIISSKMHVMKPFYIVVVLSPYLDVSLLVVVLLMVLILFATMMVFMYW